MCGAWCPTCQSYQPIKRNLTVDQKPARKAYDVIGHELGCGHMYGNEDFMKIQVIVNEIRVEAAEKTRKLEDETRSKLAKALAVMTAKVEK